MNILPLLENNLVNWKRYVDDTLAYIKEEKIEDVLNTLNSFDNAIKFTFECEKNEHISFLDVNIYRKENKLETSVYRKSTNTDLYINWNSHAPIQWKKSTLRGLVKRAITICSSESILDDELKYLETIFINKNQYPKNFVTSIINDEIQKSKLPVITPTNDISNQPEILNLSLPFNGTKGEHIVNKMKKNIKKFLKPNVSTRIVYKSSKLASKFKIKDKVNFIHKNNIVYLCRCPEDSCIETYIGETNRRIQERILDHNGRDKNSHVYKHSNNVNHKHVWLDDFEILDSNYTSTYKRKLSESLFIKKYNSTLNTQENSVKLNLFN